VIKILCVRGSIGITIKLNIPNKPRMKAQDIICSLWKGLLNPFFLIIILLYLWLYIVCCQASNLELIYHKSRALNTW